MAHPDHETVVVSIDGDATPEQLAALSEAMNEWQDEMCKYIEGLAKDLNVSLDCAGMISYLRGRSRWTQEKENELIRLDQAGEPLPNVLAGEF